MTLLRVMADSDADDLLLRTTDPALIGAELNRRGIVFDRRPTASNPPTTSTDDVLAAYAEHISELNSDGRYKHVDVVSIHPDDSDPQWPDKAKAAREKFRSEHRHAENEVRFFASGRGCFYLHLDGEVLAVVCEGGDLLSVPAGTPHWFDMGARPDLSAIRFFEDENGWVGDFSGNTISARFPTLDALLAT
ncbi:MAG TPA: cupin domain-containing protein [Pseudonocardiaceae bacterium]|jgi:1,2-dihydroxy-3-keto-5-methylthiopentene dioxygenase|nr:cupin domain-containing protein [Pseudonocardiaceae bacterium]